MTVCGVLIGDVLDKQSIITDAIPLFHGPILAPMLEIAFIQVDLYCERNNKKILGIYYANEGFNFEVSDIAAIIGDKVNEVCAGALLVMVDNANLMEDSLPLLTHTKKKEKWEPQNNAIETTIAFNEMKQVLFDYIKNNHQTQLNDFQNSLDRISCDWFNKNLFQSRNKED